MSGVCASPRAMYNNQPNYGFRENAQGDGGKGADVTYSKDLLKEPSPPRSFEAASMEGARLVLEWGFPLKNFKRGVDLFQLLFRETLNSSRNQNNENSTKLGAWNVAKIIEDVQNFDVHTKTTPKRLLKNGYTHATRVSIEGLKSNATYFFQLTPYRVREDEAAVEHNLKEDKSKDKEGTKPKGSKRIQKRGKLKGRRKKTQINMRAKNKMQRIRKEEILGTGGLVAALIVSTYI